MHSLAWLHQMAGLPSVWGWGVGWGGGCTIGAGNTGRAQVQDCTAKCAQGACHGRYVNGNGGSHGARTISCQISGCWVYALVAFAGFMWCDELLKLQCSDIAFSHESMTIGIKSSKTDQYREGVIFQHGCMSCLHNGSVLGGGLYQGG